MLAKRSTITYSAGIMKMAMAVGDSRNYVIDSIVPRHFLQTAARSGIADALVYGIFDELAAQVPLALDSVLNALPAGFPARLTASIADGVRRRLGGMTTP